MVLRIQPARWQSLLLASAGLLPFAACGGATDTSPFEGSSGNGGTSPGGSGNRAGSAGTHAGGSVNVAGSGGSINVAGAGGSVNVAGAGGSINIAGSAGTTGSAGASSTNPFPCNHPTPIISASSGYEQCDGGFVRRVGPAACAAGGVCTTDAQCGAGNVCFCSPNGGMGSCTSATCLSGTDCAPGFDCIDGGAGIGQPLCGLNSGFSCQQPSDACASAETCGVCSGCMSSASAGRHCQPCCAVGRPFLVGGEARRAEPTCRTDWLREGLTPELGDLTITERQTIATFWRDNALMEHASIAAFSRFTLDLLSLGAPPDLIEQATRAMLDETSHTQACFALASAYSRQACGPAGLRVSDSMQQRRLTEIVLTTVLEGCIGETVAALEAAEALQHTREPAVRSVLEQIARDELRHAALAYRFVRWALTLGTSQLQSQVEAAFASALAEHVASPSPASLDEPRLSAHGLLSAAQRHELRGRVLSELVTPILPALLAA